MRTAPAAFAAIAAAVLFLTGCAASTPEVSADEPSQQAVAEASESPTPLVANTAEAENAAVTDAEAEYLREIHAQMEQPISQIPDDATDAQLLSAGEAACELIAANTPVEDITVIDGETRLEATNDYRDSATIADAARRHFCPELEFNQG